MLQCLDKIADWYYQCSDRTADWCYNVQIGQLIDATNIQEVLDELIKEDIDLLAAEIEQQVTEQIVIDALQELVETNDNEVNFFWSSLFFSFQAKTNKNLTTPLT